MLANVNTSIDDISAVSFCSTEGVGIDRLLQRNFFTMANYVSFNVFSENSSLDPAYRVEIFYNRCIT